MSRRIVCDSLALCRRRVRPRSSLVPVTRAENHMKMAQHDLAVTTRNCVMSIKKQKKEKKKEQGKHEREQVACIETPSLREMSGQFYTRHSTVSQHAVSTALRREKEYPFPSLKCVHAHAILGDEK